MSLPSNGRSKLHPTEKNHELLKELILDNTNEGDIVFDPCMGSGAHGKVAIENGRRFIGIEIDEGYFKIAKERIEGADDTTLPMSTMQRRFLCR